MSRQFTRDDIGRLTLRQRIALISQLWDSLEQEHVPLTSAQEVELERRLSTLDQDQRDSVSWEALKAELERNCP